MDQTALTNPTIENLVTDELFDLAYAWLCDRRRNHSHNSDVWDLRFHWPTLKPVLMRQILAGTYQFSPLRKVYLDDQILEIWSAQDALVLKALAILLGRTLQLSKRCCHLKGNGGAKKAVREVVEKLPKNQFVFRTDVKSYYASIKHEILFEQLQEVIDDPAILDLLWQYMRRTVVDGGEYEEIQQGISLGCPLSPFMGALFLDRLDQKMAATGLVYWRFMDDWVILAPTRWPW